MLYHVIRDTATNLAFSECLQTPIGNAHQNTNFGVCRFLLFSCLFLSFVFFVVFVFLRFNVKVPFWLSKRRPLESSGLGFDESSCEGWNPGEAWRGLETTLEDGRMGVSVVGRVRVDLRSNRVRVGPDLVIGLG